MRNTEIARFGIILVLLTGCSTSGGYGQETLQQDLDAIRNRGVVGVQARVVRDSVTLAGTSGVADIHTRAPVPENGYYRIASTTKTFVATVALQLVGEGHLSL